MRRILLVLGIITVLTFPFTCDSRAGEFEVHTEHDATFKVWCRHDALYWGSVVGEAHQVRMMLGWYENDRFKGWHVQPQIKYKNDWWYFRCEERYSAKYKQPVLKLILISMPKKEGDVWRPAYSMPFAQFALLHNSWIITKNGKPFNSQIKLWNKEMNKLIHILKDLERKNYE